MRTSKKFAITIVCKKYGKIVCGRSITLATVQFSFFLFFNTPILAIQLPQFNFFYYKFLAISLPKFLFLSPTSITSFLSPLSYFFLEFWQWCCRNLLLSLFWQISLNSTHITNKLHFLQYSAKRLCLAHMLFVVFYLLSLLCENDKLEI